jgi:hypothetical protein
LNQMKAVDGRIDLNLARSLKTVLTTNVHWREFNTQFIINNALLEISKIDAAGELGSEVKVISKLNWSFSRGSILIKLSALLGSWGCSRS